MNPRKLSLAVSLPAALILGASAIHSRGPAAVDLAGIVAAIDLDKVFAEWHEAQRRIDNVKRDQEAMNADLKRREDAVLALKNEIVGFERGTEGWHRANIAYSSAANELDMWRESYGAQMKDKFDDAQLEVFELLEKAVADFAVGRKLQLVFRLRSKPREELSTQVALKAITSRELLYAGPKLDVTDAFINFLKGWSK